MAGLTPTSAQSWTAAQSRAQFAALARLRWCIFRNTIRRTKPATPGAQVLLVVQIAFSVLVYAIIGIFALGPIAAAGFGGYFLVASGRLAMLPVLTWAIFALWQLVVLNISPPGLSFDINTIIRFPLSFPRYLAARLFFGILSTSNVVGTLALIAADIGIAIAKPSLLPWSSLLLATFALTNIFFTRMVLAWVDRWLSTRRAREIFTAFILFASLGFQYLNVTFNPGMQGRHHHSSARLPILLKIFHHVQPIAAVLPPGLTAASIVSSDRGRPAAAIASLFALTAFAGLFLCVYAWRMQREFRGENLSEVSRPTPSPSVRNGAVTSTRMPHSAATLPEGRVQTSIFGLNSTIIACLEKEFIYLRRNTNQLFGFVAPLFMVFLFATRMSANGRFGDFVFPAAVAYSILGVSVLSYNSLGMDGTGVQLYFLSPTRLRDVFLAKNITAFLLTLAELVLIFVVITFVTHPPPFVIAAATICWLLFATFINCAVGNLRSISAPKKIDLSKISRRQASQFSVFIALGILAASVGIGFGIFLLARYLDGPWIMVPVFLALALVSFMFYLQVLNRLDIIALRRREHLAEELWKA